MTFEQQLISNAPMLISLATTGVVWLFRNWLPIIAHKPKSILIGVSSIVVFAYAYFHFQMTGQMIDIFKTITTTVAQAAGVYGLTKQTKPKVLGTM